MFRPGAFALVSHVGFPPIPVIPLTPTCGHSRLCGNFMRMDVCEEKVLLSPDRCGRVAIVRRPDGLLCLYQHWHWTSESQQALGAGPVVDRRWTTVYDPVLYDDVDPLPGVYGTIEDAEREARRLIREHGS